MDDSVQKLISGTVEEFSDNIVTFIKNHIQLEDSTKIQMLQDNELRVHVWQTLSQYLSNTEHSAMHCHCLSAMRILSRDKTDIDKIITSELIKQLLQLAGLYQMTKGQKLPTSDVSIESSKVLCNLLYHSFKAQELILKTDCLQCLVRHINCYTYDIPSDAVLFNIRILFIITALNVPARKIVRIDLDGDDCLITILDTLWQQYSSQTTFTPKKEDLLLACDALKVLFNLYIQPEGTTVEEQKKNMNLIMCLYKFLDNKNWAEHDELVSNIVNLLTVIPLNCYSQLIQHVNNKQSDKSQQDTNIPAMLVLLEFLDKKLNCETNLIENLSPIVTALIRLVRADKYIRRYVRLKVLPPLKDVMKRPEEGTTLKAKLCKLLTSPITEVRDLVAEFLFVLCKENVGRMVKYTGYGNAAGMFANKGLLGHRQKAYYSSESEDSDTEEYLKYKEQINPVTGCYEKAKPNPLEGMSEEQKEYEAIQLVSLVDKLTRGGVVQPCRIGEDGKPKPIEHVLELQDEFQKQQFKPNDSDSD